MYALVTSSKGFRPEASSARIGGANLVGNLSRTCRRRGCDGVYAGAFAAHGCAGAVGAGSFVAARSRASLSFGDRGIATDHHGQSVAPRRCALDDGGRVALSRACRCYWRGVGRSARPQLYCHETACLALGTGGRAVLVDPACSHTKPECSTGSLANRGAALSPQPLRRTRTRKTAMGAGPVSLASGETGQMGGGI